MTWYHDAEQLAAAIARHGSVRATAAATGVGRTTLRKWIDRHEISTAAAGSGKDAAAAPGATITGSEAELRSRPVRVGVDRLTPDELLREHGLDPADWIVGEPTVKRWTVLTGKDADGEQGVAVMSQIIVRARRRPDLGLLQAPPLDRFVRPLPTVERATERPRLIVVCSDPHHPYIDRELHAAMLGFLADMQPDEGFDLGDGINASAAGRHRPNPAFHETLNECLDSEVQAWHDRVVASPATRWRRLPGNHDDWLRRYQLERAAALYGVRRGQLEEEIARGDVEPPALSLARLLRLEEFGVEMIEAPRDGEYHDARVRIAPGLVAIHGVQAGRQGAYRAALRLTCSQMQGHDHKQSLEYVTRYDDEHRAGDAAAVSVGSLARRILGYDDAPDNQQGFATVTVWPDGRWHIELARWDAGELVWRDRRWHP